MEEIAMFGAGCFWGVEATFRKIKGVLKTEVGYAGGDQENPTYRQVCRNSTGHAEVVRISFDPSRITYKDLLEVFWKCHNPTTKNRQGPDVGSQYRSVIFYFTKEQKQQAMASCEKLIKHNAYPERIVTEIIPASDFYRAEEYHQQYLEKQGR